VIEITEAEIKLNCCIIYKKDKINKALTLRLVSCNEKIEDMNFQRRYENRVR